MKKRKLRTRKVTSLLLAILMVFSIMPFNMIVYAEDISIQGRIDALYNLMGEKYFNVGQNTGCGAKSGGHSCDNCKTSNIVNAQWFKDLFGTCSANQFANQYENTGAGYRIGWSCYGFANFAEWYIFKTSNTDTVSTQNMGTYNFDYSNITQYAKIGDILRLDNSHSVIFISANENGINVLDSNWSGSYNCKVSKHDISYSNYSTFTISRATNYNNYYSGICGSNITWTLDSSTGVLTISGSGAMNNYHYTSSGPWQEYESCIDYVIIEDGVTSIGEYAFRHCENIKNFTLPNSISSIGMGAFCKCISLEYITIPESVTQIWYDAFYGCTNLKSIVIPDKVSQIRNYTFYKCASLESIVISGNVTSIGFNAFDKCINLKDVYYSGSEADWEKISIGSDNAPLTNATIHFNSNGIDNGEENDTTVCEHKDENQDGVCDTCSKVLEQKEEPKEEPKEEATGFIEKVVNFFQAIVNFFRNLFK